MIMVMDGGSGLPLPRKKMQCGSLVVREEKKVDSLIPSRSQNRLTE
jgi:hypothetical protein